MATTKYTQEQINAALAEELRLKPSLSQAALTSAGKSLGLSDAQINAAFDTLAGFNAQGQWDAADYMANRVSGKTDYQLQVDAARAAAQNELRTKGPQQSVTDPITGQVKTLTRYNPDFNPNDPYTLAMLGSQIGTGDTNATAFFAENPSYVQKATDAWNTEKARLAEIDRVNALNASKGLLDTGVNNYAAGAVVNADGSVKIGDKLYSASDAALYNAYRGGNVAEVNRLLAANKLTGADVKSKFGLTDADIAWITNNVGGKFYSPTGTGTGTNTGITGIINTIAGNQNQAATPTGQFRELFPSFAESKRLAGEMVANRPTTQSIVNMISNPQNPALTTAWQNAEKTGQYGDVANMIKGMPIGKIQSAYGLSNADMQYIMSRPEIATALSNTGTTTTAAPSLTNVLGMISK